MRLSHLIAIPLGAATAAIAVAACGGSSNSSDTTGATTHAAKTAAGVTTTAKSATTTSPRTTSATTATTQPTTTAETATGTIAVGGAGLGSGGLSECSVENLAAKQLSSQGASGKEVLVYALVNTGSSACYTEGFPGIGFLESNGAVAPTTPSRVTSDDAGSTGSPKKITLEPGNEASFRVIVNESSSGGGGACVTASTIEITPPNSYANFKQTLSPGVPTCGSGTVTPMLTGTSANP